ncbi:uncharacterized protein LOC135821164 [Sycon ciliatum]|uniref:uncharacterized protein LOC135821164 n=1 Tax=Sycon ciliatum TaxID=27933 RepID=UPI0031F627D9
MPKASDQPTPSKKQRSSAKKPSDASKKDPPKESQTPKKKETEEQQRKERWRTLVAEKGAIPCEHEGCTVSLTTVPGMIYHFKTCRVFKERQKALIAATKPPPSGHGPCWTRPSDVAPRLLDLVSLSTEVICSWSPTKLKSLTQAIKVKCRQCGVWLSSYLLLAVHYKTCNPYCSHTSSKVAGYTCSDCQMWYMYRRELDAHTSAQHKKVNTDEIDEKERIRNWRTAVGSGEHIKCSYENCDLEFATVSEAKYHYINCEVQRRKLGSSTQATLAKARAAARDAGNDSDEGVEVKVVDGRGKGPTDEFTTEQMTFWKSELTESGAIKCLTPNCEARLRSLTAIKYHVKVCYEFTAEDCTCKLCSQVLESPRLLGAHTRAHKRKERKEKEKLEKKEKGKASLWDDEPITMFGRRKSAMKCLQQGFAEKAGSGDNSDDDNDLEKSLLTFSEADLCSFQSMLAEKGHANCVLEECKEQFSTLGDLKEHYRQKHPHLLVIPRGVKRKHKRQEHTKDNSFQLHQADMDEALKSEAENDEAVESLTEDEDDSDGELGSRHGKRTYPSRSERSVPFQPWAESNRKTHRTFRLNNDSSSGTVLFERVACVAKDWTPMSESKATEYLSVIDEVSPPFCCPGSKTTVQTLTRFSSMSYQGGRDKQASRSAFYVGGAPWSMKWCPTPCSVKRSEQYLMVSAKRSKSVTRQSDISPGKGILQLWSCGTLTKTKQDKSPSLALTICHDFGFVWDAEWCPSGVWQDPKLGKQGVADGSLPRLGLLALATSSGFVGILSIPHPQHLPKYRSKSSPYVYSVKSFTKLSSSRSAQTPPRGQALGVAWHPKQPHRYLATAFALGLVCVWDLATTSPLLFVNSSSGPEIFCQKMMQAECSAVRSLSWCPSEENLLAAGFQDASFHIWDVSNPSYPIYSVQLPGPATVISWLPHWPCILVGIDGSLGHHGDCLYAMRWKWDETCHTKRPIQVASGITMSLSEPSGSGIVAVGSAHGHVTLISLPSPSCSWPYNVGLRGLKAVQIRRSPSTVKYASPSGKKAADGASVDGSGLPSTSTTVLPPPTSSSSNGTLQAGGTPMDTTAEPQADSSANSVPSPSLTTSLSTLDYAGVRAFSMDAGSGIYLAENSTIMTFARQQASAVSKAGSNAVLYTDITASLLPAILQVAWNKKQEGWLATATASGVIMVDDYGSLT